MSRADCGVDVVEPPESVASVQCVVGDAEATSLPSGEADTTLVYQLAKSPVGYTWSSDRKLAARLLQVRCAFFHNVGLAHIDSLFRLRALQLSTGEGPFDAVSVIYLRPASPEEPLAPGLARRIRHSWPFRSVLFVGDESVATAMATEGIKVVSAAEAETFGPDDFDRHPSSKRSEATPSQKIGVHIQPAWGRCGSSTAFANETDCLLDRGLFTIRVYLDDYRQPGATYTRDYVQIFAGNAIDASPNVETAAFLPGGPVAGAANAFDELEQLAEKRMLAVMPDHFLSLLAAKATCVITNHAHSVGFAMRLCPNASIVLDTHDYLTRNSVDCARESGNANAFPDCATVRRHVDLERLLWQAADVCTTVSRDEEKRIGRNSSHCLMVLPQSYAKRWVAPGAEAVWDLLLVADAHLFNINSVEWFLASVVVPNERMKRLRIAIVGSVKGYLEAAWTKRLPNVHWLGYVRDLDETRNQSRIAVCPDRRGTGISIKALTAIATGQPMVATSVALRGLPQAVRDAMPVFDAPDAIAQDIFRLLDDASAAEERSSVAQHVLELLQRDASFEAALELAERTSAQTEAARKALLERFGRARASRPELKFENGKVKLDFRAGGSASAFLGVGWHRGEPWGAWMDGSRASLRVPADWFAKPAMLEVGTMNSGRSIQLALSCCGRVLKPCTRQTASYAAFWIDESFTVPDQDFVDIEMIASPSHCPADEGKPDQRILGAPLIYLSLDRNLELDRVHRIELGNNGQAEPFLVSGWHYPEDWGRWTSANRAMLRLPVQWLPQAERLQIRFLQSVRPVDVEVWCGAHRLANFTLTKDCLLPIPIEPTMFADADIDVVLEIVVATTFCPIKQGTGDDDRDLGVRIGSVEVVPPRRVEWRRWWRRLLEFRIG